MHQIVMLTALTATTGLFGGGRCHQRGQCYAPARSCAAAPVYYHQNAGCYQGAVAPAPQGYYHAAPAPQATQQVVQPTAYNVPSYYYGASSCPGGNCYRR